MKRSLVSAIIALCAISNNGLARQTVRFDKLEKPRVIVLTDITNGPDDEESMVRFLVYANEFDVEDLIANVKKAKEAGTSHGSREK